MRNSFKFILFIAFISLSNTAFAQKDWQWPAHGIGFSAPANLKVTTNNESEFSAEGSDVFITINPVHDASITEEHLADALVAAAHELAYEEINAADHVENEDFAGYFVEGKKDGVGALIILLLDKKSSTNLIIVMAYTSDAGRTKALGIADSFYALD